MRLDKVMEAASGNIVLAGAGRKRDGSMVTVDYTRCPKNESAILDNHRQILRLV
jgi:hypothetical protein